MESPSGKHETKGRNGEYNYKKYHEQVVNSLRAESVVPWVPEGFFLFCFAATKTPQNKTKTKKNFWHPG